jgi:hypothetical protein
MQISKPEGAVAVVFKDEDDNPRQGPVFFKIGGRSDFPYDGELVNAFDSEYEAPGGGFRAGWMSMAETRRMAKHFTLPVLEI